MTTAKSLYSILQFGQYGSIESPKSMQDLVIQQKSQYFRQLKFQHKKKPNLI